MRIIVYGIGAVGGTIAARLALSGKDVAGIARGGMLAAIKANGSLELVTPQGTERASFLCVADPAELDVRPDDVVILTVKAHQTQAALDRLRSAGYWQQPIVCAQNGVENERLALRYFPNVYGLLLMIPAQYRVAGRVEAIGAPKHGLFDIGRYPRGSDAVCTQISEVLNASNFLVDVVDDIMLSKYGKLLLNLGNIVGAALGTEKRFGTWYQSARDEGEAVCRAAGIEPVYVDPDHPRREMLKSIDVLGAERVGNSSLQSLLRGAGSIETDYLNGEIVLLGRMCGVDTPINEALARIASIMVEQNIPPGAFPEEDLELMVAQARAFQSSVRN